MLVVMAPAPSSSIIVAVVDDVTERSPSVATTTSAAVAVAAAAPLVVALAPATMGGDMLKKVSSSSSAVSSKGAMILAESGKSDAVSSLNNNNSSAGAEKESSSENFVRTLSGSRLNAKAPEFVPKSIVSPSSVTSGSAVSLSALISGSSLPIPGVIPVQFAEPSVTLSQFDSMPPAIAATSPPVVVGAVVSPPHPLELEEGDLTQASTPLQTHATAAPGPAPAAPGPAHPHAHAPHPKPVITEELKAKIVKQVEFYFSDQNLPTDNYLMKLVRKDPDGFVPIPVVASFRKIKNLVKNNGVVAAALRNSTLLVVSDDGKKVRRAQPLPDVDLEEVQSRTVVAENLPEDHSIESVEQLFGTVGTVKMVRICQPEATNGASQTAAKFKSDMVVSNKLHALVEFETIEQAEKAVVTLTDQGNWRSGLRVRLLLRRTFQSKHGFQQGPFQKGRKAGGEESGEDDEAGAEDKTGEDFGQQYDRSEEAPGNDGAGTVDRDSGGKRGKGRGRGRGMAGRGKGQHGGSHHVGSNGSRNHQSGTSPQTSHNLMASEVVGRPPPGPRMPDGTRGFTLGRGKALPIMGSA